MEKISEQLLQMTDPRHFPNLSKDALKSEEKRINEILNGKNPNGEEWNGREKELLGITLRAIKNIIGIN